MGTGFTEIFYLRTGGFEASPFGDGSQMGRLQKPLFPKEKKKGDISKNENNGLNK